MREYKTDQDRFLDLWLDLADFREAETREQLAEAKSRVDNAVKAVMKGNHSLLVASEAEAREWRTQFVRDILQESSLGCQKGLYSVGHCVE